MNKIHTKIVFMIVFGIIQISTFSQSYPITDLVGQYPLRSKDKNSTTSFPRFTDVGAWDISLKGNHGKVVPNSGVKANKCFEVTEFKRKTYIKGIAKGKIQLNKDPFESYLDDFTIAFWIEKGAYGSILQTNILLIDMSPSGELNIHWKSSGTNRVEHVLLTNSDDTDDGWYNFALIYAKSSKKLTIYLNGILKKEFTIDLLTQRYDNSASLMPLSDFMGGLANVSFAKTSYDINQLKALNDILSDDEQYARRKFRHYPLDAPNLGKEIISGKGALEVNGVGYTLNRNGEANKAANFDQRGSIILPYLFGENAVTDDYDETQGVTISLWMKVETPESTPQEGITPVFDPLKDTFYSVLYGIDDEVNAKAPIFGLQRVKDRLGVNTYIKRSDNTKHLWYNWFYDPVDFRNKTGWFHIIYVQHQNWTKVYV
ncbi:MAG TPA: hypothetical protein DDZ41_00685, partial [Flavobacterium sp.]|nr:hypothetical protein [Flavobacterium sp.]